MNSFPRFARPVVPLLICLMAGMISGHKFQIRAPIPLLVAVICFIMVIRAIQKKKEMLLFPLIMVVCLGFLHVQKPHDLEKRLESEGHIRFYADKDDISLRGTVRDEPRLDKRDQTFILDSIVLDIDEQRQMPVEGRLKVRAALSGLEFTKGDRIVITGKIKSFRNFNNPGGFDYKRFMEDDDVWGNFYAKKGNASLASKGRLSPVDRMRRYVEKFIDRSWASTDGKEVLKALITGNKKGIPETLRDAFARTGTSHLLAISGLHVGMVAGFSFFVFRIFFSLIPFFLWRGTVRIWAGILTLFPVWLYAMMAGMSPSTQRAAIMVSVVLLAYSFMAEQDILNTLCIAAFTILAIAPEFLFQISFQLSFASVFAIVWGMEALSRLLEKKEDQTTEPSPNPAIRKFFTYMAVSMFAFAGTWPLVAYYFNQLSLIGFLANALLIPVVGMGVVPLGLASALGCGVLDFPFLFMMNIAGSLADGSIMAIRFFSSFSWSAFRVVTPSILEMACYYTLLFCLIGLVKAGRSGKILKRAMVTGAALAVVILCVDGAYWARERYFHHDLRVTWLDVGQGASALVEFPGGRSMLIDGGGFSDNEMFDVGEKLVAPFLWSKKIAHVETVVLSHPESDHLNGLLYILEHFRVDELWTSGVERDTRGYLRMMELANQNKIQVISRDNLPEHQVLNGVEVYVFWPLPSDDMATFFYSRNTNNMSLVLKLCLGDQSFLFPGDILEVAETAIIQSMADPEMLKSRVFLVPHHGSKSSSSEMFLQAVSPEYAVISAGYRNRFRFPHPSVIERLHGAGARVYRTDLDGAVSMATDGRGLRIESVLH